MKNSTQNSQSSSSDDEEENFPKSCLKAHNEHRALHNVLPLKLSKKLCAYAQEWAEKLAKDDQMAHRPETSYGENVFSLFTSEPGRQVKGKEPVQAWYSEITKHVFGAEPNDTSTGHFTQLIWKETKILGVGIAKSATGKFYVVCNYDPPGNFVGEYKENVLPPLSALKKPAVAKKPEEPVGKSNTKKKKKTKKAEDEKATKSDDNGRKNLEGSQLVMTPSNFAVECLEAHNELRKKHEVIELTLDPQLTKYAEEWAKVLAKEDKMSHRQERKYGENIYSYWSKKPGEMISGKDPVAVWYKEISHHEFFKEPTNAKTGHFTQVVWKDSKRLGVGVAKSRTNRFYVVANYDPPGNYAGEFKTCVPPIGGFPKRDQSENNKNATVLVAKPAVNQEGPLKNEELSTVHATSNILHPVPISSEVQKIVEDQLEGKKKEEVKNLPSLESGMSIEKQIPESAIQKKSTKEKSTEMNSEVDKLNETQGEMDVSIHEVLQKKVTETHQPQLPVSALSFEEMLKEATKVTENEARAKSKDEEKDFEISLTLSNKEGKLTPQMSLTSPTNGKLKKQELFEEEIVGQIFSDFQMNCLNAHNKYREEHKIGPLALSSELCNRATDWAEHLASIDRMESRGDPNYGENLYCYWSSNLAKKLVGHEPATSWYQEIDVYDFKAVNDVQPKAGNFTQMIWKSSQRMGVAVARSDSGKFYVVANYEPCGNQLGKYQQNIFPKGGPTEEVLQAMRRSEFNLTVFSEECLAKHNASRALHGADPLRLSKKISKYAQEWANSLAQADAAIHHRTQRKYGENIYSVYGPGGHLEITGDSPVTCWYNEMKQYTFGKEPNNLKAGHFTQVVWRSSRKLGVGAAWSSSGRLYVVCNYDPPGNIIGKFHNNVCPLGWKEKYTSSEESSSEEEVASGKVALEDFVNENLLPSNLVNPSSQKVETCEVIAQNDRIENVMEDTVGETEAENGFTEECLKLHNAYRALHRVPPLELDEKLMKKTKEHAEDLAKNDCMKPYSSDDYGENVFSRWSSKEKVKLSPHDVVGTWYSECQKYNYDSEPKILKAGHFTQLVWSKSHRIGIGKATSPKSGRVYVVALYDPPGNYKGYFKKNVFAPLKLDQSEC